MDGVLVQSISEVLIRILIGQANLHAHMTPPPIFKHSTPPIKCSVMAQESHFALLSHYLSLYCINKGLSFPRQECLKNKTWQKILYVWQVHAQNQAKWRETGGDKVLITKVNYCLWVALNRFTCGNKKVSLLISPILLQGLNSHLPYWLKHSHAKTCVCVCGHMCVCPCRKLQLQSPVHYSLLTPESLKII